MIGLFLAGAALLLSPLPMSDSGDADLRARAALAAVPGVTFLLAPAPDAQGAQGTPDAPPPGAELVDPPCTPAQPILCDVNWGSMPAAIRPRPLPPGWQGARVLLRTRTGAPIALVRPHEVLLALDPSPALRRWPYWNYVLHGAARIAADQTPPRFADWPHAPLPGPRVKRLALLFFAGVWLTLLLLYRLARRRGRARPDAAAAFFARLDALPRDRGATDTPDARSFWSRAGFARPLSGLLTLLGAMLLLIGPYFALQSLLGKRVQPFPEADGLWRYTVDVLFIAWLTFDLGTQTALVKYFAEHRATRPEEALRDVQFYVWFQLFSRLVEGTLLALLATGVLPRTNYALYAPFVLLYSGMCIQSLGGLGKLVCQAAQRFDVSNLLDLVETRALVFIVPIPFVLLGRAYGLSHPEIGEAFGAALGLGLGQMATDLCVFTIGHLALRRIGVPLGSMYLAQFTAETVRRQLTFGVKVTLGQEPFRLTSFLESLILLRWLADFPSWLGIRDLIHNRLAFLFFFAWNYYQSAVPAISEALGAGKRRLAQYYVARYLQFGFLFSATVFALLCAVGPTFVRHALGAQWGRAEGFLILGSLSGLLLPLAWLSDSVQQGAGRPGTTTVVMLIEQGLRLTLLLVLVPRLQFAGMYAAMLTALCVKCALGWTLNHRRVMPLELPLWPSLGAPLCAGVLTFLVLRGLVLVCAPTATWAVLALFFVGGAASFLLSFFGCALAGGFDRAALEELHQAAEMSALVRPISRVLVGAAALGARLSPRPPAVRPLSADAAREALELTGR